MDFQDLRNYFQDIIKKYLPYKESKMYEVVIDFLVENYLKDLYNDNLSNFKQLFEEGTILTNIYDQLLLGIGVPQKVLDELNFNHKVIFLASLSDFQRYKGTISFFENVAKSFSDKFNVYELYIAYEGGTWILKPYPIYKGSDFGSDITSISYSETYEKVPTLLVSEEQLDSIRDDNNATFPIKTNLILLDYSDYKEINAFGNLIISTLLKEYGPLLVTTYFNDENFDFELKDLYYIWYYVVTRYYGTTWLKFNLQQVIHFSESANPYDMSGIDNLLSEFESLKTSPDISDFYEENIAVFFRTIYQCSEQTEDDMKLIVKNINEDFYDYLEDRLNGLTGDSLTQEVNSILSEMYNSLILFYRNNSGDEYILRYFETLLYSLPQITVEPDATVSYVILHNFKPFHVEFISRTRTSIVSNDKLNTVTPKDLDFEFALQLAHTDFVGNLDDKGFFDIVFNSKSTLDMISLHTFLYECNTNDEFTISDDFKYALDHYSNTVYTILDEAISSTSVELPGNEIDWGVDQLEGFEFDTSTEISSNDIVFLNPDITIPDDVYTVLDNLEFLIPKTLMSHLSIISLHLQNFNTVSNNDLNLADDFTIVQED